MLFFVSLGERYAEIIADRETNARIGATTWERILGDYITAAKSRPLADAIVAAIESCAAVLQSPVGAA